MLFQALSRSLLGLPGHLPAQVLASSACQTLLQQMSLGSSSCSTLQMHLFKYTSSIACTSAGSSSDGPVSAATAQEGAPSTRPHPAAEGTASGAVHTWLTSSCSSTQRLTVLLMPAAEGSKSLWPAAAVQARGVHNRPAGSGGRGKDRGKGRLGVAAVGVTPRQQRWSPQSGSKGVSASARQLTSLLKGAATPQQLLQLLQRHKLQQQGGVLDAIHVATCYHCLGVMCQADAAAAGTTVQQLLHHLDQLLMSVRGQLGPRQLSNIIWSCAYTQHVAPLGQLLPDFLQPGTLSRANSWDVSNVLWALASLEQQVPQQQLQQLVDAVVSQADNAAPQGISSSVWALGKLGYHVLQQQQLSVLLEAFTAAGMLSKANTQDIAILLLGMAYMGQQLPDAQLRLLEDALVSKLSRANTQDVANSLWAVSELGQQMQAEPLGQLLGAILKQLHSAVPQDISHTLLAVARFRHVPVKLLKALEQQQHVQRFLAAAEPQQLANAAWACGMLGHNSKQLLGHLLQQAVNLLQQDSSRFVCQALSNLCWAVAVLDMRQCVHAVLQLAEAASRVWGSAAPEGLQQLYQAHLWLLDHSLAAAEGGKGPGLLQVLSQQQLDECCRAWQDQVASGALQTPSSMQQWVFAALQQLPGWQVPPQQEVLTADSNFSIDIAAVTAAGIRLAVEVDGPSHFNSPGNRVNGPTQYRIKALTARGYTVVSIPYWQWDALRGSQQQQDYLKRRLQGLIPSTEPVAAAVSAPAEQPPPTATQGSRRRVRSTKRRRDSIH